MNRYILLDIQDHHVFWYHRPGCIIPQAFLNEYMIPKCKPGCLQIKNNKDRQETMKEYYWDPIKLIQSPNLTPELEKLNVFSEWTIYEAPLGLITIWVTIEYYIEHDMEMIFRHMKLFHFETGYLLRHIIFLAFSRHGKICDNNKNKDTPPTQVLKFCRLAHQRGFLLIDRYLRKRDDYQLNLFGEVNLLRDLTYDCYQMLDDLGYITSEMTEIMKYYFDNIDSRPIPRDLLKYLYVKKLISQEELYEYFECFDTEPEITISEYMYAGIPLDEKLFEIFLSLVPKYRSNNIGQDEIFKVTGYFTEASLSDTPRLYEI